MRRSRAMITVIWCFALASESLGETTQQSPIEVTADKVSYDVNSGVAEFDTSVVITQGALSVEAEFVEVHRAADDSSATERIEIRDSVHIRHGGSELTAGRCVYVIAELTITCREDVEISFAPGTSTLTGQAVTYDLESGRVFVTGAPKALIGPDAD